MAEEESKLDSPVVIESGRFSADLMDEQRQEKIAYEYLCRLEETKKWIEACIGESLPETTVLEEHLRNGVYLAKLAHNFAPGLVPLKKIYDADQEIYRQSGLKFRHTDNIHQWLEFMRQLDFPKIFMPETTDLFDKKNLPRVIYCIHALSLHLFYLRMAPQMEDLNGTVEFSMDDIRAMSRELKNVKFPLPQFGKIGGILANELPLNESEHPAAIAAINAALNERNSEDLLQALTKPAARLLNVQRSLGHIYCGAMVDALEKKRAESGSAASLSKDEIQVHVDYVNEFAALDELAMAVEKKDPEDMLRCLKKSELKLSDVRSPNASRYLEVLTEILRDGDFVTGEVKRALHEVNKQADNVSRYVAAINQALQGNSQDLIKVLLKFSREAAAGKVDVLEFAAPLYLEEMKTFRTLTAEDLDYETICGALSTLTKIARVSLAVDSKSNQQLLVALGTPQLFEDVDSSLIQSYMETLMALRDSKLRDGMKCPVLTHLDIQNCIDEVNSQDRQELDSLSVLNQCVACEDLPNLMKVLMNLPLDGINADLGPLYLRLLKTLSSTKKQVPGIDHSLSMDDVEEVLRKSDQFSSEAVHWCRLLSSLHFSRDSSERCAALRSLMAPARLSNKQETGFLRHFDFVSREHDIAGVIAPESWIFMRLEQGIPVYLNLRLKQVSWTKPEEYRNNRLFTCDQIKSMFAQLCQASERKEMEKLMTKFQARARGYLLREKLSRNVEHYRRNIDRVIRIQAWWRGVIQRKRFSLYLEERKAKKGAAAANNAFFYAQHIGKIILIQAAWRRWREVKAFRAITAGKDVSLSTLRRFLHLLDIGQRDFREELQVQQLKAEVVQTIRRNKKLEKDLKVMDVKIGLLVRNQIALQDVVAHGNKLRKQVKNQGGFTDTRPDIELLSMTKQGQQKLEAYQHLFYLLQTEPSYLAKLLFIQPQDISPVIMSVYNYGSNLREEFLLLKLLKIALEEEIHHKVDSLNDVTTGTPMVITLVLNASRQGHSLLMLREILSPLVNKILRDSSQYISISPIEAYKHWINQMEVSTGQPCGLPYYVSPAQALEHAAVQKTINDSIAYLKKATLAFLNHITSDVNRIPYSMLYLSKVMARLLRAKFPNIPEKEILKVVGNLIYYRYLNTAIVAPDTFGIVSVSSTDVITTEQRKNLAQIAKLLQFAAAKKGFGEENAHLMCLNSFLIECHEQFKSFFKKCIQVDEPEVHFGMDQYTEATMLSRPVIHLTLREMTDVHKLLVEYESILAPMADDPLHQILDDFGPQRNQPSLNHLLAAAGNKENVGTFNTLAEVAKTEIALALTNKYELPLTSSPTSEKSQKLFVNTKQMLVNIVRCSKGETVKEVLIKPVDEEEQSLYSQLLAQQKRNAEPNLDTTHRLVHSPSNSDSAAEPSLYNLKMKVVRNLRTLEKSGFLSFGNNYDDLKESLAQDLINMRMHRRARTQELARLLETKVLLEEKTKFHEEQAEYYHQYLDTCLKNLTAGKTQKKMQHHKQQSSSSKNVKTLKLKSALKYSGAKLHQKGILLEIDGLTPSHLKSIFFSIAPTAEHGVFDIAAKFMGTEVEKVQLNIQDLLQMQYEGVSVLNLFNKARINVNLFLYLVNVKFYGAAR